jgi:hypothetical protein
LPILLVCDWPHSVFEQNHLFVKMLLNRDFTIQKHSRWFCAAFKTEVFRVPVSRPDDRVIPSGCPSVHCSIRPDDIPYRPDARHTKHHPSGRRDFPSGCTTVSRSFCSSLHPSGRFSSLSGCLSVIDQLQILSKYNLRENRFNCPDDVDSRPDALIHKARIVIQISPSTRQSTLVRTRVHQLRKLPIQLQPSRRLPIMVRTRA